MNKKKYLCGSEKKHQTIQDNLESRLKKYGYKVYHNIEYYDEDKERVVGELDVIAIKTNDEGYLSGITIYEVKSGRESYQHATQQLYRARKYFSANKHGIVPRLVYVTADRHGALKARRVR